MPRTISHRDTRPIADRGWIYQDDDRAEELKVARRDSNTARDIRPMHAISDMAQPAGGYAKLDYMLTQDGALVLRPRIGRNSGILAEAIYQVTKRTLDILGSLIALVMLMPAMLLTVLLIKLTDRGPVLYGHTRVGQGGREFSCYKFRSMVLDADKRLAELQQLNEHKDDRTFKLVNDPRVTRVGRWLRRTSFDEVPQLWNVLVGDMSLVGPRPPVPQEVSRYTLYDIQRLAVKPGLTCTWQVSGRSRIPFPEQLEMDLRYIQNRSIALDLKLLLMTIPAVISADGAY